MIDYVAARTTMVDCQVRPSDVTLYPIIDAMLAVPREAYVPTALKPVAYAGEHVPLAPGRVVLDPRVFSKMLDALAIGPDDLVLDIGCGLGYSTAVIAQLAEAVIGIEAEADLAAEAASTLMAEGVHNAVVHQAPLAEGDAAHGPHDVIIVQGGVQQIPQALLDQLKDGGRVAAIFMTGIAGHVRVGVKAGDTIAWRHAFDATAPTLDGFEAAQGFEF